MKKGRFFPFAIAILVLFLAFYFSACGSDEAAPTDPTTTSTIPDIVFFNTIDPSAVVLFEGRASDNTRVQSVLISFDNGAVWHTADIDNTPPNTLWNVEWSFLADAADIPAVMNTLLIKASDGDGNEVVSSPIPLVKKSGLDVPSLQAAFSSATADEIIALSSGNGGAYGTSATPLTIPIDVDLTVLGSGYGSTTTSGGVSFPAVASTATILQSSVTGASIFSVDANLSLKNLRLLGAESAVSLSDTGSDPELVIEDCVFDQQGAWAVFAQDSDSGVVVQFLSSAVDASQAASSSRGGLFLNNVGYLVQESGFYYQTDPAGPEDDTVQGAAVKVFDGSGEITGSLFEDNGLAIWASGGDALITSCTISSTANSTYGINLTGGPASPVLRHNKISNNTGYGLRISGVMTAKVRNCVITSNGQSGVYIDSGDFLLDLLNIDLGKTSDFGNNDLYGNTHPDATPTTDAELYVSSNTSTIGSNLRIPAEYNYWGVPEIQAEDRVYHGFDNPSRAWVDFRPAFSSERN